MSDKRPVCIVTGASRGIGAATARMAARKGYAVVVNFIRDKAAAQTVVDQIIAEGGAAVGIQADIADPIAVSKLFEKTLRELGRPVALVNNAAEPGERRSIDQIDSESLRRILMVTLAGPLYCTAEAVRHMSRDRGGAGGSIVNLSSQAARTGGRLLTPYASAKAGLETATIALARELGPSGIRVNAVSPGRIESNAHANEQRASGDAALDIPLGRLGSADEVAETVLWLMSPAAAYVSGAVVAVTGGR